VAKNRVTGNALAGHTHATGSNTRGLLRSACAKPSAIRQSQSAKITAQGTTGGHSPHRDNNNRKSPFHDANNAIVTATSKNDEYHFSENEALLR
jgi:hypothetical protein